MVPRYLHSSKEGGYSTTREHLATISPHYASYSGRDVGKGNIFPDVSGTYKYEEIAREGIGNGAQHGYIPFHIEGKHQYKEAHHHDK